MRAVPQVPQYPVRETGVSGLLRGPVQGGGRNRRKKSLAVSVSECVRIRHRGNGEAADLAEGARPGASVRFREKSPCGNGRKRASGRITGEKDFMQKSLNLFWSFFKVGVFTFGGGYAMVPLIEKEWSIAGRGSIARNSSTC